MTKMTYFTATFLALSISLTSCKKDDDAASAQKSNSEKLTAHDWVLTQSVINPQINFGNGPSSNGLLLMEECERDNLYIYDTEGNYIGDEGPVKCDEFGGQRGVLGTWELNADETELTLNTKAFGIEVVKLTNITETTMVIEGVKNIGGTDITYTNTYTPK